MSEPADDGFSQRDREHMARALALARKAAAAGEVPVGAVLADANGRLRYAEHNRSITLLDPTAHAEMLAIRGAAGIMGNYRLTGCTLYVTLEPCPMCAGALVWARVGRVVYAASDPKAGALGSTMDLSRQPETLNHKLRVEKGLMAEESVALLQEFFQARRGK